MKIIVNGKSMTDIEYEIWRKRRERRLKAAGLSMADMFAAKSPPAIVTDTLHVRVNRSGLKEHEKRMIAKRARRLGMPEESCYDPTIPGQTIYESRAQADAAIQRDKDAANRREGKPVHRLAPKHVHGIKQRMIAADPSLRKQDQRELEQEIVNRHSLPE